MADYGRGGGRGGRGGRGREVGGGRGGGRGGMPSSRHTLMLVLPPLHSVFASGPWLSCFASLLFDILRLCSAAYSPRVVIRGQ